MKKKAIDWFSQNTTGDLRDILLNNSIRFPSRPQMVVESIWEAIDVAFVWEKTPEGEETWQSCFYGQTFEPLSIKDNINPSHYKHMEKEVWEMMVDIWGEEAAMKHFEMSAFKYRMRAGRKNNHEEDIKKAMWYEDKCKELKGKI